MYSIRNYGEMIQDAPRMDAYVRALRRAVTPGCVVADIGTGTGIFALLACRLGARRVFAIEPGDAIALAREIAAANGCSDRIEFFQAESTEISLPEAADVIVSDLRGILPLFQRHLAAIRDARRRFLAPGGKLIPQSDSIWCALVEEPEAHARVTSPWQDSGFDLDMSAGSRVLANAFYRIAPRPEALASPPQYLATLDYRSLEEVDFRAQAQLVASRAATVHGICVWFDSTLTDGVEVSNAPGQPPLIYGSAFFPWPRAVTLQAGDEVGLRIRADLVATDYVWTWESSVRQEGAGVPRAEFKQSEFFSELLSRDALNRRAGACAPGLGESGQIQLFILSEMAQGHALQDIARQVAARYPKRFARGEEALAYVGGISVQFGGTP